jgi:hypothetical protein
MNRGIYFNLFLLLFCSMWSYSMAAAAPIEDPPMPEVVSLFLIKVDPQHYEGKSLCVSCFIKQHECGTVAYATEDAAKYDMIEYGLLLDLGRCGNLDVFKAGVAARSRGYCHEFIAVLASGDFETRDGEGTVRLPILAVERYIASRAQGTRLAPSSAKAREAMTSGTRQSDRLVVSPWSLLLDPVRHSRERVITHGFVANDPEGNWLLWASTDSAKYALPEFVFLRPGEEALKRELGKEIRPGELGSAVLVGRVEDPKSGDGFRIPYSPRMGIAKVIAVPSGD